MKTNIVIGTILFLFLYFGCNNPTDELPNNLTLDYYTSYEYNDKGELVSEKTYSSTDSLRSIKTSTYNSEGKLIKETDWQPEAGIIGLYVYSYDTLGNRKSQRVYDNAGKRKSTCVYFYDKNNLISTNILYNSKNKIRFKFENCIDTAKGIEYVIHFDTAGIPESFDSTIWTSKNVCRQISFKNNKSTLEYTDTYDDKKRLIERIQYDENGNIVQKLKWENFIEEDAKNTTFYNSDNEITTFALDKYNERGPKVRTEWYKSKTEK